MKNSTGTFFGRSHGSGHYTVAGGMAAEKAALMQPLDEVVVLLGGGVLAALMRQWCELALVQCLVIRFVSVPKVGTVPLIDLHFKLNILLI